MTSGADPARCPRCGSERAQSLSPAVRDWFCCAECGHIWPDDTKSPKPGTTAELPR